MFGWGMGGDGWGVDGGGEGGGGGGGRGLKCVSDLSSIKSRQGLDSCGQPHISTLSENSSREMTLSMNSN